MSRQLVLFPNERPLVERLGNDFFQQAPESPGVYLMRGGSDEVLYIGKAKNLRKRLRSYRVANPDRMGRRHLRLVNAVNRIELFQCESESSALAKEAALLRNLKPRFNRAGTWSAHAKYLAWRIDETGMKLSLASIAESDWTSMGPMGSWAIFARNALLRRLWCGLFPERGLCGMAPGWAQGKCGNTVTISVPAAVISQHELIDRRAAFLRRELDPLLEWVQTQAAHNDNPFEAMARNEDIELLAEVCERK